VTIGVGVNARTIEQLCQQMHDEWREKNAKRGLHSVESPRGEELMVPWAHLSQIAREDLHRRDARRVLFNLAMMGLTMTHPRTWQ
jgi:hypothetical protein